MIQLDPPWKVATPMGDAEARILDPGSADDVSRLLCVIEATGELWWLTQRDVRINTNMTEGRTRITPFSAEAMTRFAAVRLAAERLNDKG
ncbi:hypothetical protein ACRAVF_33735 (plasmid) [Bradyrhizobium oligotrophicum S58]